MMHLRGVNSTHKYKAGEERNLDPLLAVAPLPHFIDYGNIGMDAVLFQLPAYRNFMLVARMYRIPA